MIKKFIGEISKLEKKFYLLLPVVMLAAMMVFAKSNGWETLRQDVFIYVNLMFATICLFFLVKKSTYLLGHFYLSLMGNAAFQGVPKDVILWRYRIMSYGSALLATIAFIWGIYYSADLVMIFSWSLLGITVSSKRLIEEIK